MRMRHFYDPFAEMNRLVDSLSTARPDERETAPASPSVNVWEQPGAYLAEAELPGVVLSDIEVTASDTDVTIRGTRSSNTSDDVAVLRSERRNGPFERTLSLPLAIDPAAVEATLTNGVLTLTLPKAAHVQPRRITVQTTQPDGGAS